MISRTNPLLLAVLVLTGFVLPAAATDYHVRPDGNDSCNGTSPSTGTGGNCAWASVAKCFGFGNNAPGAGDRCLVHPGEYYGWNGQEDREQSNGGSKKSGSHNNCSCTHGSRTITCNSVNVETASPVVMPGDFVQCADGTGFSWTEVESTQFADNQSTITLKEDYRGCDYRTCSDPGDRSVSGGRLEVARLVQILGWDRSANREADVGEVVLSAWRPQPGSVSWKRAGTCNGNGSTVCTSDAQCSGNCVLSACVYTYDSSATSDSVWGSTSPQGYRENFDTWDIWEGTDNDGDGQVDSAGLGRGDPLRNLTPSGSASACGNETAFEQVNRVPGSYGEVGSKRIVHSYTCQDPDSLDFQASTQADGPSSALLITNKPYTIIASLTLEAAHRESNNSNGSRGFQGGASNALYRDLRQRTGQFYMQMGATDSDTRFESIDAWFSAQLSSGGASQSHSGLHLYDFEMRGGRNNTFTTDNLIGASSSDRVIIDRVYVHRGITQWRSDTWDCATDTWTQPWRATHGMYIGSLGGGRRINHVLVQNSIWETTQDGLGLFVALGNTDVIVRNNTFGWHGKRIHAGNGEDGNWHITYINNATQRADDHVTQAYGLTDPGCANRNWTADHNAYISVDNNDNEGRDSHWWVNRGCGGGTSASVASFEEVVDPGGPYRQEQNSLFVCTGASCSGQHGEYYNDVSHGFVDPRPSRTGGGDYSLTASSRLIDAGDSTNCPDEDFYGNLRNDGACDIGAVEYQGVGRDIYFEAEEGVLTSPMHASSDSGAPVAYGGRLIETDEGTGDVLSGEPTGQARFSVRVTEPGDYTLWVRMFAPDTGHNSFWESMNGGTNKILQTGQSGTWVWVRGQVYPLIEGTHTLQLKHRHEQAKADRILLTSKEGRNPSDEEPPPPPPPPPSTVSGLTRTDRRGS